MGITLMPDEQTVIKFFDSVNRRDMKDMENLLTENAEFYFPKTQPLIGKKRVLRFFSILFRQYPQLSFGIQSVIIQGSRAAVHWKNRGVNRRNEPYENEGVTILEFAGGRISFISDFFKDTEKFY
jgi:ketosteroid isomerase-like protein